MGISEEKNIGTIEVNSVPSEPQLDDAGFKRGLGRRQVTMITFGAGIGTGLWVGSGQALLKGGPAGIAIAYTVMAFMVYLMYQSIGEMTAYKPVHGGFIRQSLEYVGPAWAFALGLNFCFNWIVVFPAEVVAAVSILKFWPNDVPDAAWVTIFVVILIVGNLFPVKVYGEIEYWMSMVKLLAVAGMIFFLLISTCGGVPGHGSIGFQFWKNPGPFNFGFKGVCAAFVQAGFSFGGGEHIAVIAGETAEPRKTVKQTIKPVFLRMCLFFVLNIWLVTMNVPYNDDSLANKSGTLASPFVIATQRAGVPWLGHVLNAFILIAVVSCGNSGVYIASRTLVSLSDLKLVHPIFGKKDKAGRPYIALAVCLTLGVILSYLTLSETGEQIYAWFSSLVSMANYITWFSIYLSHVRFRAGLKAQDIDFKSLPFVDRSAPWGQYIGLVVISVIIIFQGYLALFPIHKTPSAKNFFASYLSMPLFAGEFLIYKFWYKTKFVKASEMDFSAAAVFDEIDYQENLKPKEPTKSIFMRVVGSIF